MDGTELKSSRRRSNLMRMLFRLALYCRASTEGQRGTAVTPPCGRPPLLPSLLAFSRIATERAFTVRCSGDNISTHYQLTPHWSLCLRSVWFCRRKRLRVHPIVDYQRDITTEEANSDGRRREGKGAALTGESRRIGSRMGGRGPGMRSLQMSRPITRAKSICEME